VIITIHQAICGEKNKAWELLKTTLGENSFAKKIAFQTDLQDSPPSGLQWQPVIRGFLFGDHFLIIKTYPDNSPDVRNGRVFSHCLILDKQDLHKITDISPLFSVFKVELDKTIQLEPIILTLDRQDNVVLKESLQLRFNKVIQSFIKFSNNSEPIVWVGQKHFEIAVCKLWQLLTPAQREGFHFGINFNASEVVRDKLTFVVIPDNSESKFENKGFTIIRKDDSVELKELSEQFLAGEPNAIGRINKFVSEIEAPNPTLKELSTITKCITTFENIENEKDLKLLNTLSNIIAKYSPEESKGSSLKAKLVERISLLAENADELDVFLLRNYQTKSFRGSQINISHAIDKWCSNYLLNEKQNQKVVYSSFIVKVAEAPKENWLVKLISKKVSKFLSGINATTAKIIWQWISNDVNILNKIGNNIENTKRAETHFITTLPKSAEVDFAEVKLFASKRKWFRLLATILKTQLEFKEAMTEQLKVDLDNDNFEGIEILVDGVKPNDIISFAIFNRDKRLIHLSGGLCNRDIKLLGDIKIENATWQEVWLAAITCGNKVFEGIPEPLKTANLLYDLLINGKTVCEGLLDKISETEFANVLNYANRNKLWTNVPSKVKNKFLEKTSSAFLKALSENSTYQVPTDAELSNYVISNGIEVFLYFNRNNIKNVLPIFIFYEQIPEYIIKDYISNYSGKLDVVDSTDLGKLVLSRNYSTVANIIKSKTREIRNLKFALTECYPLLGFFDKASLYFSGIIDDSTITKNEWWASFFDLVIRLYPEGPTKNEIWKQAGGHNHDLNIGSTGKESWTKALHKLENGGCDNITQIELLKVMLKEYPNNQELKTLKDLWKNI
jgi:hypothetical protein